MSEVEGVLEQGSRAGISEDVVASVIRRAITDLLASFGHQPPRVFLSYSHTNKGTVRKIAHGLQAAGIEVWLDEAALNLGDSLITKIERGLDSADYVAFFLSKASLQSPWARQELNVAISRQISKDRGAVIIPILLEDTEIPSLLRDVMYLDMRDGDVALGVKKLISAISRHQIERSNTHATSINRYFNPPERIRDVGSRLYGGDFVELVSQLQGDQVLLGLYRNQVGALIATHLHSRERMNEMEGLWAPSEGITPLVDKTPMMVSITRFPSKGQKNDFTMLGATLSQAASSILVPGWAPIMDGWSFFARMLYAGNGFLWVRVEAVFCYESSSVKGGVKVSHCGGVKGDHAGATRSGEHSRADWWAGRIKRFY